MTHEGASRSGSLSAGRRCGNGYAHRHRRGRVVVTRTDQLRIFAADRLEACHGVATDSTECRAFAVNDRPANVTGSHVLLRCRYFTDGECSALSIPPLARPKRINASSVPKKAAINHASSRDCRRDRTGAVEWYEVFTISAASEAEVVHCNRRPTVALSSIF